MDKHNVSAIRRVRKSDNNRVALAVGATIVNRIEDLRESDVGTKCGLFNIEKIGDEFVHFLFTDIKVSQTSHIITIIFIDFQVFHLPY